jgi:hypothetical protein
MCMGVLGEEQKCHIWQTCRTDIQNPKGSYVPSNACLYPVGHWRESDTLKPENRISFNSVIVIPV